MEKVSLAVKAYKNKTIEYNGVEFEISPFLTLAEQAFLIERYLEEYFSELQENVVANGVFRVLDAEIGLMNAIFQMKTNVDPESLLNDVYADSVLLNLIAGEIVNYESFRRLLDKFVEDKVRERELETSVGHAFNTLFEKGMDLLQGFSALKPEEIEKARETGLELIKELEKNSLLNPDFSEGKKPTKRGRGRPRKNEQA